MSQNSDVTAIPSLDLNRYLGKWYEICRLPLRWEDTGATDITARYFLNESGTVRVDNRCFDEEGEPTRAVAEATPQDEAKSRLKVNFLPEYLRWLPFTSGDYWVLKIDADYTTSLVGTPDRKNLWILSRTPELSTAIREDYLAEARRQGFDLSELITPVHTGRDVTDDLATAEAHSLRAKKQEAMASCSEVWASEISLRAEGSPRRSRE
jgi:apolipoprotein D and lipocalin family protein